MPTLYERLTAFNRNRLPDMLKLKYKAMSLNAFSFYRGTCHLFYQDLAAAPPLPPSPSVWICGDLHLENFGSFKGDDRQEYFDLNDFDEAQLAPANWEIARMTASIFVAFYSLGLKESEASKTARLFLDNYCDTLKNAKARVIDPRTAEGIVKAFLDKVQERKPKELLKKFRHGKKDKLELLRDDGRHIEVDKQLKNELSHFIEDTLQNSCYASHKYQVRDCVFRLAGTGSIGVRRYLFLLKSTNEKNKYLLLDMKQAMTSSLAPYVTIKQQVLASEAERVIAIQERAQNVSPALLMAVMFKDEAYVLKQMQPMEDKINFELLKDRYDEIDAVIRDMAVITASAQLRSGGRQGSAIADELIAWSQNNLQKGGIDAVLKYALDYAGQVKKDYKEFMQGYKKGIYN